MNANLLTQDQLLCNSNTEKNGMAKSSESDAFPNSYFQISTVDIMMQLIV